MARHAQPREVADLKGSYKKHPERYRKEPPKSGKPLGKPPKHLLDAAEQAWKEIEKQCLPGVMTGADRFILEIASNLLAEYRSNPAEFAVGKYAHLIGSLARMGLSPGDRQKLGVTPESPEDEEFKDF